jgi:tRNA pseudouridine38-40 synthase
MSEVESAAQSSPLVRYKIVVAYDGTDYFGWQIQKDVPTIASVLQDTFQQVFNRNISIVGASRTDTGVHAEGQVASFVTDLTVSPAHMRKAWNNLLPPAIMIRSLDAVAEDFHPQRNVQYKIYHYHFSLTRPMPKTARYDWYVRYSVDMEKLRTGLQTFVGTHDFRAFCTMEEGDTRGTVRTIDAIDVECVSAEQLQYRVVVRGHSFLHYMVRRIVGAALQVSYRPDLSVQELVVALQSKDPRSTFVKAPAHGLCLHQIVYKN